MKILGGDLNSLSAFCATMYIATVVSDVARL